MQTETNIRAKVAELEDFAVSLEHARDEMVPRFQQPGSEEAIQVFNQRLKSLLMSIRALRYTLEEDKLSARDY